MSTQVTAAQVKSLRDRTGAKMNDCRLALIEAEGNEDTAVEIMRKKGLSDVTRRAGAVATEGRVEAYIHPNNRIGVLIELNCQTDFAAKSEEFVGFCRDVAMHIAASSPSYVRREDVPETEKAKMREIFKGQLYEADKVTGKSRPEAVVAKVVEGKLDKWYSEVCLNDQELVTRDDKKTIGTLSDEMTVRTGEKVSLRRFVRFELGEGVQKRTVDFAAEVAAQLRPDNFDPLKVYKA